MSTLAFYFLQSALLLESEIPHQSALCESVILLSLLGATVCGKQHVCLLEGFITSVFNAVLLHHHTFPLIKHQFIQIKSLAHSSLIHTFYHLKMKIQQVMSAL